MTEKEKNIIVDKIKNLIEKLRVYLQNDGGDMEFVGYTEETKTLTIKILGACVGCSFIGDTFDSGIGEIIKTEISEVHEIIFI
ncbi:MAG: NifU family protein [Mycoplasmataceae bacterium]|jgi:Fe-S cluster biogenesis protein NfuA|nr:NifU family protein [Mycoplasmataceae bacterium]